MSLTHLLSRTILGSLCKCERFTIHLGTEPSYPTPFFASGQHTTALGLLQSPPTELVFLSKAYSETLCHFAPTYLNVWP
jgi:hypothetical protein